MNTAMPEPSPSATLKHSSDPRDLPDDKRIDYVRADRWIAISDGGSGLEDWLRVNFARVEAVILDFYHASEHLGDLAKAWHGPGTEESERHRGVVEAARMAERR